MNDRIASIIDCCSELDYVLKKICLDGGSFIIKGFNDYNLAVRGNDDDPSRVDIAILTDEIPTGCIDPRSTMSVQLIKGLEQPLEIEKVVELLELPMLSISPMLSFKIGRPIEILFLSRYCR